ncbi:pre-peptidase C-terminal domain-containing protein [Thermomonas sp.]|uniref:M4 family metallopeptidase n=1 Tax=Thermomonas sp. TaxID=1971895 RepID=UPI00248A219C|nr:pre-peptidase C-terminal domain-containing protein [Thermomonas sp.]MDI1252362.1 M4 family metallopeptidase [Thermomonas sp.]
MNRSIRITALALASVAFAGGAAAANRVDLHGTNLSHLKQQYQSVAATHGIAAMRHTRHEQFIGTDANSRLLMKRNHASHGVRNYRYDQTFRGIPVFGEGIVVSEDAAGNVRKLFGNMASGLEQDITSVKPSLSKAQGLLAGKRAGLGKRLSGMLTENESSNLVIFIDDAGRGHLAYAVSFFADAVAGGSPTRPTVLVDAQNGRVLKQWEALTTANGTGPGGNQKTGQYEFGTDFGYMNVGQSGNTCTMNNSNVRAVNLNGSTGSSTTAFTYTCPRNTYKTINGGYSPINDAFYFGGVITDMYPAYTGYNALSFQLIMRVHYSSQYENAFWNGSNMSFGDGKNTFYPLVSSDVAGHEVSHGFTEQHSNLTYSGQSGGMNEAFSDMGGEATEYYLKGSNDYLVGQEIFKGNGALRYMCNPTQDGSSIDNASNYTSGMDPHYSSGVYNKMFCKLAKTSGWGVPTAFKVMARANAEYWTSSSTYASGACGVITAATDLGLSTSAVAAAFTSVGVSTSSCGGGGGGGTGGALTKGTAVSGISQSTGNDVVYTMVVPSGATALSFTMSGGTGDADMYVKFGSTPTDTSYDCRPYKSGNSESCSFASPSTGTYYVRLKAYSSFTGASLIGDYTAGGGGGGGSSSVLLPTVSRGNTSATYTLTVASGQTGVISISGGTGDADLYVKKGSAPTTSSYDCRPYKSGNSESCTVTSAGTYYMNVRAYQSFSGVTLTGATSP